VSTPETQAALRALLRHKVHIRPRTLAALPTAQSQRLRSPFELGRMLLRPLASTPAELPAFWAQHSRGHVVIGNHPQGYLPGPQQVGRQLLDGVAWVPAAFLLASPYLAEPIANLLDHLLGCDGDPGGTWLSDGAGRSPLWHEVGQRLQRQFHLGYAPEGARRHPHSYFAWGLATYLEDRLALSVSDPGLERLLSTTLFAPAFWRRNQP
jgi:hypothetical protein